MARLTLVFAAGLIVLGIVGYLGGGAPATDVGVEEPTGASADDAAVATPKRSVTALIPAFAGGLLLLFGVLALNESWRMHAMHGAVLIGLLGFLAAGGRGAMGLAKVMSGDTTVNTRSLFFVCAMAVICAVFVMLCVNSFIQARKQRQREADTPST